MRFALVNNERVEAAPKLEGLCPGCSQAVISKCGQYKIWHWAHRTKINCDRWSEPETEWHRAWKSKFPKEWQETIMYDGQTGEKYIADVRTEHELVIEFQHSHIDPLERTTRERFYGNMVWIVNGTRLKRDYPRFQKAWPSFRPLVKNGYFCVPFPEECFPADWLGSSVPVLFDFQGMGQIETPDTLRDPLWCLLLGRAGAFCVLMGVSRDDFVKTASSRAEFLPAKEIVNGVAQDLQPSPQPPPVMPRRQAMPLPPRYGPRREIGGFTRGFAKGLYLFVGPFPKQGIIEIVKRQKVRRQCPMQHHFKNRQIL